MSHPNCLQSVCSVDLKIWIFYKILGRNHSSKVLIFRVLFDEFELFSKQALAITMKI